MRKFSFRLETLLRIRERTLDVAASELRTVEGEIDSMRQYIERIRDEQVRLEHETLQKIGHGGADREKGAGRRPGEEGDGDRVTAAELKERRAYGDFLRHQLEMGRRRLASLREVREEKRSQWRRRRRDWKVIQKMMDRDRTRWQSETVREEQKVIDEVAQKGSTDRGLHFREGSEDRQRGSVLQAVLVAVLVAGLTLTILYSVHLISGKDITLLGLRSEPAVPRTPEPPQSIEVAVERVASATDDEPEIPEFDDSMLITSDMIRETLDLIEQERERLADREARLDAWEKRLERREQELESLVAEYGELRETIEADLVEQRALKEWREGEERREREASLRRLARLYERTRAREAARMMLELDSEQAQDVLISMNERQAVKILGEMSKTNPHRATELMKSLSDDAEKLDAPQAEE
jgi:flagellar motility protein MotE (MotC chaperone)/flagellar biosynthesis chaperone FliJ